jgi:hypothetical protein
MAYKWAILSGLVALAACGGCATSWQSNGNGAALTSPTVTVPQCRDGVYNRAAAMCLSPGSQ